MLLVNMQGESTRAKEPDIGMRKIQIYHAKLIFRFDLTHNVGHPLRISSACDLWLDTTTHLSWELWSSGCKTRTPISSGGTCSMASFTREFTSYSNTWPCQTTPLNFSGWTLNCSLYPIEGCAGPKEKYSLDFRFIPKYFAKWFLLQCGF